MMANSSYDLILLAHYLIGVRYLLHCKGLDFLCMYYVPKDFKDRKDSYAPPISRTVTS